ncbi:TerB family tellurite resistance protein [Methyloferula stellata]|uniref:tellurite resistance TerB family protein n=1 Tax=Methyloferula stellata TaxID=876270 RepID=UPI000381F8AE|nr:TerB family tellurite resistance protein [Methyloferula stellata]
MFAALKNLLADLGQTETPRRFGEDDYRVAAVALLVHVADADGVTDAAESRRLKTLVKERFGLDAGEAAALIREAQQSDREAVDFYHFTHVLKRQLDDEGRHRIIEMMWDMAFADGTVDEIEENTVWRVAELLGVSNRDRVLLRQKVAAETRSEAAPEGPWSPKPARGEA